MSYAELAQCKVRIERLKIEKQNAERAQLRERIIAMVKDHGLEIGDLFGKGRKGKGSVAIKYRDPQNPENTWSGRGRMPRWMTAATKAGKAKKEDFLAEVARRSWRAVLERLAATLVLSDGRRLSRTSDTASSWLCRTRRSQRRLCLIRTRGRAVSGEGRRECAASKREGMMRKGLIAGVVALVLEITAVRAEPAAPPAGTYRMDRAHSSLTWKVNHLGLSNYTARFTKFDATLDIDPASPQSAKVVVTVDPTSVRTDYPFTERRDFDKDLGGGENFFNAKEFTRITFSSTRVERTGKTTANVTGDLTLRGITKPLTIYVTLNGAKQHPMAQAPALGFSGVAKLKRSDFGMTFMLPLIGDEVTLLIEAEFIRS